MTEEEINKAIARIILSTKRKKRQFNLFEIALDIESLKNEKGGMKEVSKLIGVSAGMLSQFLSVFKLPEPIVELVKERKIDSVSIVHHLAKYNSEDKQKLVELLSSKELLSQDLRILIPYRKQYPNESIIELVERIHSSKNIKVSVIRINKNDTEKTIIELGSIFTKEVDKENLITVESKDDVIDIKVTKQGEKILREKAKRNGKTFQELITILIN